jgi:predicted DNA-binding antitoxin AbrB/MazE fold protein
MAGSSISVEAIFEDGVLRPMQPLPLASRQRVTLIVELPPAFPGWPADVGKIYQEIAAEDRRPAEVMWGAAKETWPASGQRQ